VTVSAWPYTQPQCLWWRELPPTGSGLHASHEPTALLLSYLRGAAAAGGFAAGARAAGGGAAGLAAGGGGGACCCYPYP
jgi:hypothetical protein